MKPKLLREIKKRVADAGLELIDVVQTKGDHMRITVRRPLDGMQRFFIEAMSVSDTRSNRNALQALKRFAEGRDPARRAAEGVS